LNIIIADDESLIRFGLCSIIAELNPRWNVVSEAVNGEEMVEKVKLLQPDVVLVDIKMPKLNGLEAIEICKQVSPHTKWIILTGFSKFEYAKEAIKQGASDYLLKPVSPEELGRVLQKIEQEHQNRKLLQNKQFEHDIVALYHGMADEDSVESYVLRLQFQSLLFYIDSYMPESEKLQRYRHLYQEILSIMQLRSERSMLTAFFVLPSGDLALVGAWEDEAYNGSREFDDCIRDVEHAVQSLQSDSFAVTVLKSGPHTTFETLNEQIHELQKMSILRAAIGIGKTWTYESLSDRHKHHRSLIKISKLAHEMTIHFKDKNYLNYMKSVQDLIDINQVNEQLVTNGTMNKFVKFINLSIGCAIGCDEYSNSIFQKLKEHGERLLTENYRAEKEKRDIADQVIAYVEQHYTNNIGIGQIAEELNVTPNYLSMLFHKKTGTTFVKYLTHIRVLKAKELLTNSDIQVQRAAEMVGYYSTRHFSKVFKEWVGCYPSEYKRKFN
jgi:two-component system response regulator YesN